MAIINSLVLSLVSDISKFSGPLKKAAGDVGSFASTARKHLGSIASGVESMGSKFAGPVGAGAAAIAGLTVGLGAIVKGSLDSAKATQTLAERIDISTESLSRLQYAAGTVGIGAEEFGDALSDMQEKLGDAEMGGGEAVEALMALGITLDSIKGKRADEVFTTLTDAISKTGDQANRLHLADQLFGGSGQALLPLLNQGAEGLQRLGAEADRLGVTLSAAGGENAKAASAALDQLWSVGVGLAQTLAVELSPLITDVATRFATWVTSFGEGGGIITSVLGGVGKAIGSVAQVVDFLGGGFKVLQSVVSGVFSVIATTIASVVTPIEYFLKLVTGMESTVGSTLKAIGKDLSDLSDKQMTEGLDQILNPTDRGGWQKYFDSMITASKTSMAKFTGIVPGKAVNKEPEKEKKAEKDALKAEAESLTKALRTPAEIFRDEVAKVGELMQKGLISAETYDRALLKAKKEFGESAEKAEENIGFAGAADFRTAEGRSALLAASGINTDGLKKTAVEQLAEQRKTVRAIERLAASMGGEEVVSII